MDGERLMIEQQLSDCKLKLDKEGPSKAGRKQSGVEQDESSDEDRGAMNSDDEIPI